MATIISTKTSGVGGLEVTGDASGVLQLASNNGTTAVTVDASQNVGIGTASPTDKLTINGRLTFSNLFSASNIDGIFLQSGVGTTVNTATGNNIVFNNGTTERMRIDSTGNVSIIQTPGKYTVDTTGGATSIANGGTVDFPNASGMLVVNNWTNGGVSIYLFGGGASAIIGSVIGAVGTTAYNSGINGYRWTNNTGSTSTFGFFFVRTRLTA